MRQDSTVARALAAEYLLDPRGLSPRVVIDELMSTLAARDAEIERLKRKLDLFRQMAEKINSLSSERLGEPLANAILGLLAAIDEATKEAK